MIDYTTGLLESLQVILRHDLQPIMGWNDVLIDWPESPEHVKAWDKPVVFLQCAEKSSEGQAIGSRAMYFDVEILTVYPTSLIGEHMEESVKAIQRTDADILETYFYYLDQHATFIRQLEDNFENFYNMQQTAETTSRSEKMADSAGSRPALVTTATVVIEQTVVGFNLITFLTKVMQLKGQPNG